MPAETPEQTIARLKKMREAGTPVAPAATSATTPAPAPAPATRPLGASSGLVDSQAAGDNLPFVGKHPVYTGQSGAQTALARGTLGTGIGYGDVRPTGITQAGTVDPVTGLVTGGVTKAASSEYDYPSIYANHASSINQAPAVTGSAPVSAAGTAITNAITNPNVATNGYIQQGAADAASQGRLALGSANAIGTAGAADQGQTNALIAGAGGQQTGARNAQTNLIGLLTQGAEGGGPSVASALFQQSLDRVIGATDAAAANTRGGSTVAAARNAGATAATTGLDAASSAAALRAQEQQAAQQQLGTATTNMRSGDTALTQVLLEATGQARGQDIQTAQAMSDAIQGVRDGTIKAADVASTATNVLNSTNGQIQQWAIQNGLDYGKLLQAAQSGDQTAALQLTQIMAQFSASMFNTNKTATTQREGQNQQLIGGLVGGGVNGVGGAVTKAVH